MLLNVEKSGEQDEKRSKERLVNTDPGVVFYTYIYTYTLWLITFADSVDQDQAASNMHSHPLTYRDYLLYYVTLSSHNRAKIRLYIS